MRLVAGRTHAYGHRAVFGTPRKLLAPVTLETELRHIGGQHLVRTRGMRVMAGRAHSRGHRRMDHFLAREHPVVVTIEAKVGWSLL